MILMNTRVRIGIVYQIGLYQFPRSNKVSTEVYSRSVSVAVQ